MQIPHFTLRKVLPPTAFGLDISDDSIRAMQLRHAKTAFRIDFVASAELPPETVVNGEIKNPAVLAAAIASLIAPYRSIVAPAVVVALPEPKTLVQTISIPKKAGASFAQQLLETLPEYIPNSIEEIYFDAMPIHETAVSWEALVGVAEKPIVDSYVSVLENAGITPGAFDVEPAATANAIMSAGDSTSCQAIVNLGRRRANLIVVDQGKLQFTLSLPIAGETVTRELQEQLAITYEQAEKTKRLCGLDPLKCEGVLRRVLEAMVQNLITRILEGGKYYRDHFPDSRDFSNVVLTGGGAHLIGLPEVLASALNIPVSLGNVWANVPLVSQSNLEAEQRFATAIGLALRGVDLPEIL